MVSLSFVPGKLGPFRLKSLSNGLYQIHAATGLAFEGPKLKIFRKAVELGVRRTDLRIAVSDMKKFGHNVANFGVGGGYLYTYKDSKRKAA